LSHSLTKGFVASHQDYILLGGIEDAPSYPAVSRHVQPWYLGSLLTVSGTRSVPCANRTRLRGFSRRSFSRFLFPDRTSCDRLIPTIPGTRFQLAPVYFRGRLERVSRRAGRGSLWVGLGCCTSVWEPSSASRPVKLLNSNHLIDLVSFWIEQPKPLLSCWVQTLVCVGAQPPLQPQSPHGSLIVAAKHRDPEVCNHQSEEFCEGIRDEIPATRQILEPHLLPHSPASFGAIRLGR
jgi:hypothetical protein